MNKRQFAQTTGIALLLMAIVAMYSIGYAYSQFHPTEELLDLKEHISTNKGLYNSVIIGIVIIIALDFIVSYTLYKYFKNEHPNLSLTAAVIRAVYTVIFAIATVYLINNLNFKSLTNQEIATNFQSFQDVWNFGLVIFGFHIILIGVLMKKTNDIPRFLYYLTIFAGVAYVILPLLKLSPVNPEITNNLGMILALPMALGELGLAVWILIKGGKYSSLKND
ncbi:MAG: DUF4386 domain-containing protein [Crocinitomicaceae bacterium]|nr:DUF4386 domain-containing protein [Crocinitomicaceae bacterium]